MVLLLISLTSATQESLGTFKVGEEVKLKQICGTCTYNNITSISYPNSTISLSDLEMTKRGTEYNYTLSGNYTSALGEYIVNGVGDLGGTNTSWAYTFEINMSGVKVTIAQGILYSVLLALGLLFVILSFYGSMVIDGRNEFDLGGRVLSINFNKYYKIGLFFLGYLFLIWSFFMAWEISQLLTLNWANAVFHFMFNLLWILLAPVFLVFVIISLIKWMLDLELQKLGDRNLKPYGT